jgi:hypothetical protein
VGFAKFIGQHIQELGGYVGWHLKRELVASFTREIELDYVPVPRRTTPEHVGEYSIDRSLHAVRL